jgi:4-hydroxy-tetrahydrodipicolinate synthase
MGKPFDLNRLATVQLVPCTPFSRDGKQVVPEVLGAFVRELFAAGIRVFLPGAGTGEFHSLTAAEVVTCVRATRQAVGDEAVVIAPVGFGLPHALAISRGAREAGADALLVMPPIHPYLCDDGLRDYFQVLIDELPLPLLAYKKGPFPSDALLRELAGTGRLVGIKYAVNDLDALARFARGLDRRTGLYCGTAERFAPFFMMAGAQGYTTGAGNLCPRLTLAMFQALADRDYAKGMALLDVLRPIEDYRARADDSYNVSMLKFALQGTGRDFGPARPPQRRLTKAEEAEVCGLLEPILAAENKLQTEGK